MSARTTRNSSGTGSRKSSVSPQAARRTGTGGSVRRRSRAPDKSGFQVFLELILLTYFGRVVLFAVALILVIGLNIFISKNRFDMFFIMTGIELVILAVILWLRMMMKRTEQE